MPYVTVDTVRAALEQDLRKNGQGFKNPDAWNGIIGRAVTRAERDILTRLLGKGYTDAQISASDDIVSYVLDQALFWSLTEGTDSVGKDRDFSALDHRKELENPNWLGLRIGGVIVSPGGTDDGAADVQAGDLNMNTGGTDYFSTFGVGRLRQGGFNEYGDAQQAPYW